MSPFGSHAMLHGFFNPSATVTTLKASPAGPGGCAHVEVETVSVAAPMSAAARMHTVAFMDVPLLSAPRRFVQKTALPRCDRSCLPERASTFILARRLDGKRLRVIEKSAFGPD